MQTAIVLGSFVIVCIAFAVYDVKRLQKAKAQRDYQFELFERLVLAVERKVVEENAK